MKILVLFAFLAAQIFPSQIDYLVYDHGSYVTVAPPVGSLVQTLPFGFRVLSINEQRYYVYSGVFFVRDVFLDRKVFRVVECPVTVEGRLVDTAVEKVHIGGQEYLIDSSGRYYVGDTQVNPPAGSYVNELPMGTKGIDINGRLYYVHAGVFYIRIQIGSRCTYVAVDPVE